MGAVGINGVYLHVPGGPLNTGEFVGPIMQETIQKRSALTEISDQAIKQVLGDYFRELYDLATCERAKVLTDTHVATNDLPPR
jgi:hypothetical protein